MAGRASTRSVMWPQMPPPSPPLRRRNGTLSLSKLSPSKATSAGKRLTERTIAIATATMAARARLEKITLSTTNMPPMASNTVVPAKTTALPEVPLAVRSASSLESPFRRSLR